MPLGCAPVARGASACTHSPFDQAPRHVISARNFPSGGGVINSQITVRHAGSLNKSQPGGGIV